MALSQLSVIVLLGVALGSTLSAPNARRLGNMNDILKEGGKGNWAVLVAGSNTWWNYRHQADVCHAYHVLRRSGIPADRIITFMYDDIAHDASNPFPGKIFNGYDHIDYYEGVVIDYKGKDVTPEMFLRVLKGDKNLKFQGRKVLESTKEDNVFVYFTDHGGLGVLSFPEDELMADVLIETLKYMHDKHMYSEMVLYIEACHSGSMFKDLLPTNIRIYATTAANENESSYACLCEDPEIETCLGDEYSVNWIVDSEKSDQWHHTLDEQYNAVKKLTNLSHVMQYGSKDIAKEEIGQFQAHKSALTKRTHKTANEVRTPQKDLVVSHDVHLHTLRRQIKSATGEAQKQEYQRQLDAALALRVNVERSFDHIVHRVTGGDPAQIDRMNVRVGQLAAADCVFPSYKAYGRHCYALHKVSDVMIHLHKLNNLCHAGYSRDTIVAAIEHVCAEMDRQV